MGIGWKEAFTKNAKEALAKIQATSDNAAKELLSELRACGVSVTVDGESLKVKGQLTDTQRARVRAMKGELLDALRGGDPEPANKARWKASDLCIEVSLTAGGVTDFVLGPKVDDTAGAELLAELEAVLLESAPPLWAEKVRSMGGVRVYSLSQWAMAKPKLLAAVAEPVPF